MSQKAKSIGELNGWNAVLFQFMLRTWPAILALMAWLTYETTLNSAFRKSGPRFTPSDNRAAIAELKEWHHQDLESSFAAFERRLKQ